MLKNNVKNCFETFEQFLKINTYSFRIRTQSGVAKFDFFEIFYTQGPFRWKG